MMALSYSIRSKPDWQRKYRDREIRAKWRQEALSTELEDRVFAERPEESEMGYDREAEELERPRLTERMVDYILDELALHDEKLKHTNGIAVRVSRRFRRRAADSLDAQASCFTGIYESDTLVPADLREELARAVLELEKNPPFGEPDWHPGSNAQVLDLVHPSLFPLVYGKSLVLEADGKSTKTAEAPNKGQWDHSSEKYAWLPSDFDGTSRSSSSHSPPLTCIFYSRRQWQSHHLVLHQQPPPRPARPAVPHPRPRLRALHPALRRRPLRPSAASAPSHCRRLASVINLVRRRT